MNEPLAECLLEVYLNAMELLGASLQATQGLPERARARERLRRACIDAVLIARSFPRAESPVEIGWKVDQVEDRFRTAERLLRELQTAPSARRAYLSAGIEIAERGGEAARAGTRMLAEA